MRAVASTEHLPEPLPSADGYTHLLGVPMDIVEQLRSLHLAALDGQMSLDTWKERHAHALADSEPTLDSAELRRLETQVNAVATSVTEDFDRFIFLAQLATNLRLLQTPDPERELQELEKPLNPLAGENTRSEIDRRLAALRAMTGRSGEADVYEPAARMFKALQVGTLEETYRWLQAAVAEDPSSSVQDLLTRAAIEVAEAKLELDRYDDLKGRPDDHRAR
jgi:hypothetical protein